jgi:hypothetical protein
MTPTAERVPHELLAKSAPAMPESLLLCVTPKPTSPNALKRSLKEYCAPNDPVTEYASTVLAGRVGPEPVSVSELPRVNVIRGLR